MQYFVDKVCSIVTSSMNRSFDERISREHFVIRVAEINEDGVWGYHPENIDMVSFFAMPHIISIHQEIELDPENPEHAQMIKEYEAKTGKKLESDLPKAKTQEKPKQMDLLPVIEKTPEPTGSGDATFVDIKSLEKLAEISKKTFDAQDLIGKHPLS